MKEMQFTAVVLMTLLTLKLMLLPARVAAYPAINKSRWLITCGTALLAVHFLLQYIFELREKGITQPVMLNLILFIPCSYLFSLALILLQRQGRIRRVEKHLGWVIWGLSVAVLAVACVLDGKSLLSYSREKHVAEFTASFLYGLMLLYYFWRHMTYMKSMHTTLHNYYDWIMDAQLRWMYAAIIILVSIGLTVPLVIYGAGKWLAPFAIFFFACISYFVDCFCTYVIGAVPRKLQEADESEQQAHHEEEENVRPAIDTEAMNRVGRAVEKWLNGGGHLRPGMKMPNAAVEMGIPQYQLSSWLRYNNLKYTDWITNLRISEAKRILQAHPEWSNEAVAQHCGFAERCYFQTIFKKRTGLTPAEYIQTTH